jgi:hypothetical protein
MESSGGVCVVGADLCKAELVVCLCCVAYVYHEKLRVSVGGSIASQPISGTAGIARRPKKLVGSSGCRVVVIGIVCDGVKLAGVGENESLTSGVGIIVICHVCSGIGKSVLSSGVDGLSEGHVTHHTSRGTRCDGNHGRRSRRLGECGGC